MNENRNPFGSTSLAVRDTAPGRETASTAVAAQAKAMIESRYIMAMRNPRNMDLVRQELLRECRRPAFANNKSALYNKPIGRGVEGLGIRFVEVALRCMRNVLSESTMLYADDEREIHRVTVTDLETNTTWPMDIAVNKTVERSRPAEDGSYISVRKNSSGRDVYTVPANDDDLLNKRLALISKALRTAGLRIIPGDLQDEAEEIIRSVRLDSAARDPGAERKRITDAFGEMGVNAADLTEYLGHPIAACTPPELVDLRGLYGALRDGEATWATVMYNKKSESTEGPPAKPKPKTGASGLRANLVAAPEQPGWPKHDPETGAWVDSAGEVWNAEEHSAPNPRTGAAPSVNSDGTFRRRRTVAATEAPREPEPIDAPAPTYAEVAAQIRGAEGSDQLNAAWALIAGVESATHKLELEALANERLHEITPAIR